MSFSVKAKEFVPSPVAHPWTGDCGKSLNDTSMSSLTSGAAYGSHREQHHQRSGKERVCMAFYECCECPFAATCAHAHHFFELTADAQATLLMTVSIESIPAHFMGESARRPGTRGVRDGSGSPAAFTPYGRFYGSGSGAAPRGVAADTSRASTSSCGGGSHQGGPSLRRGARRTYGDDGLALGGGAADAAASGSSNASSSNYGSPRSAVRPAAPALSLEIFRVHLPARCRYPHHGAAGTYYSFLGVSRGATQEEVIAKYRLWQREAFKRMRAVDPQGAEAADHIIVEARNVLGNPMLRAEYDRSLPPAAAATAATAVATPRRSVPQASCAAGQTTSSSTGTSVSFHARLHHGHTSSSSASSVTSANGSGSHGVPRVPSSAASSIGDRLSPIPTLTTNMFSDSIW